MTHTYTQEQINDIVGLKSPDGAKIDIFDLHGLIYVGNCRNGIWDLETSHTRFSEHSIALDYDEFEDCTTEDEVNDRFYELLKEAVSERLL